MAKKKTNEEEIITGDKEWEWADVDLKEILNEAISDAITMRSQFLTIAHVLCVMADSTCFINVARKSLHEMLIEYLDANVEEVPEGIFKGCVASEDLISLCEKAKKYGKTRKKKVTPGEFLLLLSLTEYPLMDRIAEEANMSKDDFVNEIIRSEQEDEVGDAEEVEDEGFEEVEEIEDGEIEDGDSIVEEDDDDTVEITQGNIPPPELLKDLMKKLKDGKANIVQVTAKRGNPIIDSIINDMMGQIGAGGGDGEGQQKGFGRGMAGFVSCANNRPELLRAEEEANKADEEYEARTGKEGNEDDAEIAEEMNGIENDEAREEEKKTTAEALGKYNGDLAAMHLRCLNINEETLDKTIVGRETEIKRAVEILCRRDKGNVIFIGEPGVGKTAMVSALVQRIESGNVPQRMKGAIVIEADFGGFVGDAQYRGEFEKRFKAMLNAVSQIHRCYLYIDEVHTIIGAGGNHGDSMDAATLLKPYLDSGKIRLIGCTTYDDYKQTFYRSKAFARRFTKVDILEPSAEEGIRIMEGVKPRYEKYHRMSVGSEVMDFLVKSAAKHIADRRLPDKAIDLLDEVGAMCQAKRGEAEVYEVKKEDVADVLGKMTGAKILSDDEDESQKLYNLEERIKAEVYGQDKAVSEVTEAVLMASAGLQDDSKPMASLLFVGPTGVGKTETARVLAKELGVPFVKFDMSEYSEKFTVSSLIGSPKGYVGYEEGGALTDAIRKSPYCVLLLDELEKAHPDIYNILLQVMDYATLTDTKGEKADFRNVIIIMTTNAGAADAKASGVGFVKKEGAGKAMMGAVKKTFKPEFINRLTGITVFNDMTREMAGLVLGKCVRRLEEKLKAKGVTLTLSEDAKEMLLDKGYSREYGGRNVERVVNSDLKPILMKAILFGGLKKGGDAKVEVVDGELKVVNQ